MRWHCETSIIKWQHDDRSMIYMCPRQMIFAKWTTAKWQFPHSWIIYSVHSPTTTSNGMGLGQGQRHFLDKPLDCLFMSSYYIIIIYIFFSSHLTIESISVRRNSPFLPRAHGHFIKSLLFLHYITLTHPPHWSKEPNFSHQKNVSHFLRPFIYTASQFWLWSFWATFSNCVSGTLRILGKQSISHQ